MEPSEHEEKIISLLNESLPSVNNLKRRKRRGGPNSLSVKKKLKQSLPDKESVGVVTGSKVYLIVTMCFYYAI